MSDSREPTGRPRVTFIDQAAPVGEYGRALYAVARSILRALLDSLSEVDLSDLNTPIGDVTMRQLAKLARIDRDKGMRGDGFEWAVHEALLGKEPKVIQPVSEALHKCSQYIQKDVEPTSLMFGQERARYLGFVDATVDEAGKDALLIPGRRGRPFNFGPSVSIAARGQSAESELPERVKKIWKTDLFISGVDSNRHFATTVKSNISALEGGEGLRLAIVPEHAGQSPSGVRYDGNHSLWVSVWRTLTVSWVYSTTPIVRWDEPSAQWAGIHHHLITLNQAPKRFYCRSSLRSIRP